MKTTLTAIGAAILCLGCLGASATADDLQRTHDIVADDYFTIAVVTGCVMSPDGRHVVYNEMRWDKAEDKRNMDVWVVGTEAKEPLRLTFDPAADSSLSWSPDGRWIYFTSARTRAGEDKPPYDGETQVWRVAVDGGEPFPVTRVAEGIGGYELSGDGKTLFYTVGKKHVDDDPWKGLREQYPDLTYGHGVAEFDEMWKLDLVSWRSERVLADNRVIREFAISPDGRWTAMITTPTEELITHEGWSRVDIHDAKSGEIHSLPDKQWRQEAPSPYGWLSDLAWSSDGSRLAFQVDFDGYPGNIFVVQFGADGMGEPWKLTRPGEVSLAGHLEWRDGSDDLCFLAEERARKRAYCVPEVRDGRQGDRYAMTPGDVALDDFSIDESGERAAIVMGDVTHPPEVFVVPTRGRMVNYDRVTHVNPQVDTWRLPKITTIQWTSTDGTPVEGILELPPDYQAGDPLPTMLEVHGGPTAATLLRMRFWIYGRVLFPARGWALLSVNYRGSTGYGDTFMTDLVGNKNNLDVQDILSGVDHLVAQGIADPERLAVMGWSNGGYLTNCLITHTNRFKAASSGAGVFDVVTQWLSEDTPGHVVNFNKGFPWTNEQQMRRGSALYNVDKVTTPTLIHVGEKDPRCPPLQSTGLYRALHHYLNVPTELIVYPGAGHGLTSYTQRKAKMEWDIKWFDHWVLGKTTEDQGAKPGESVD